jgi:hypothetical protein
VDTPIDRDKLLSIGLLRRSPTSRERDRRAALEEEVRDHQTVQGVPIHSGRLIDLAEEFERERN